LPFKGRYVMGGGMQGRGNVARLTNAAERLSWWDL